MKFLKQFSVSLMAMGAMTAAIAANQPINPVNASITIDAAAVNANLAGYAIGTVGGATYNNGLLTAAVQGVSTATNPGPIDIELADAAGLKFTKLLNPTVTLSNFSFDVATGELSGNLVVSSGIIKLVEVVDQSVLKAGTVASSLGTDIGSSVTSSTTARNLGLVASNFTLSQSFKDYMLNVYEIDASSFNYVADMIKEVKIGTVYTPTPAVPEPSTYALMGVGLVGIAALSRRRAAK